MTDRGDRGRDRRQAVGQTWSEIGGGCDAHPEYTFEACTGIYKVLIGRMCSKKGVEGDMGQVEKSQGGMANDPPVLGDTGAHSNQVSYRPW